MSIDQREYITRAQHLLNVTPDGVFGPRTLAAIERIMGLIQDDPAPDTVRTGGNIEDRAATWCENEARHWGDRQVSAERVAEYFSTCEQDGSYAKGKWLSAETLRGKSYSFCAAAQGFAEHQVSLPDELVPPSRAGAKDYRMDAINGLRGQFMPTKLIQYGNAMPPPRGSLAIYDRPSTPQAWDGHVRRVLSASKTGYLGVGANEGIRRWKVDDNERRYDSDLNLLGFVYPRGVML